MGINHRDNRPGSNREPQDEIINLNDILAKSLKLIVVLVALIFCLRLPLIWVKLPLWFVIIICGWRWIFKSKKPQQSSPQLPPAPTSASKSSIEFFEEAVRQSSKPDRNVLRLLVAYDAAGEYGKAKTLIQKMNGEEFTEEVAEELIILAKNYFPVDLEASEKGYRFKLM